MAEAIGLAASIVGIASAGVSVVSTLTKFGISFRGSNEKINSLASRVSLTASILSDIATTVEQNASGFKKEEFWMTWRKILLSCEESYGKLDRALLKARRLGASKGKNGNDGVSVWGKLVRALGGETEMQDLETSLDRCGQQVMMMQQAVQISVLSLIAQRSDFDPISVKLTLLIGCLGKNSARKKLKINESLWANSNGCFRLCLKLASS